MAGFRDVSIGTAHMLCWVIDGVAGGVRAKRLADTLATLTRRARAAAWLLGHTAAQFPLRIVYTTCTRPESLQGIPAGFRTRLSRPLGGVLAPTGMGDVPTRAGFPPVDALHPATCLVISEEVELEGRSHGCAEQPGD